MIDKFSKHMIIYYISIFILDPPPASISNISKWGQTHHIVTGLVMNSKI